MSQDFGVQRAEQRCTGSCRSLFPVFELSRFVTQGISLRRDPRRTLVAAGDVLDAILDIGVAGLAWWALLYAAMHLGLSLDRALAVWIGGIAALAALRLRGRWYPGSARAASAWQTAGALALTAATQSARLNGGARRSGRRLLRRAHHLGCRTRRTRLSRHDLLERHLARDRWPGVVHRIHRDTPWRAGSRYRSCSG